MGAKFCQAGEAVRPQEKEDGNSKEMRQPEGEINVGEEAEEEGDMEMEDIAKVKMMEVILLIGDLITANTQIVLTSTGIF